MSAAIEFRGVAKQFGQGSDPVISGLDLTIDDGELVTFVGPSGCGKTTTLRLINRLIEPSEGTILVGGIDIATTDRNELRRDIGYVIQQVGLFPHRTVAQNIATVPKLLGWSRTEIADRVGELVDLIGLDRPLLDRHPAALSGGQQQRVGVARALAARPSVLLMDEPYSAVDPVVRSHLQDELLTLHQRVGTTIVLVTHDIDEAVRLGDRVAVFGAGGRVAQFATPDELMAAPADDFVLSFLGPDRQLRRLALHRIGSLVSDDPAGEHAVEIDASASGRNAVDLMLECGVDTVAVRSDGRIIGTVTLDQLTTALR